MIKRSQGYVRIINEPAKTRITENKCPVCDKPKNEWGNKRRKDWACCSPECTTQFENYCIIRSWPQLRSKCLERDSYTCKHCGKQPREEYSCGGHNNWSKEEVINYIKQFTDSYALVTEEPNEKITYADPSKLIADHITPIALNGEEWDINNLQTLCLNCNKKKTAQDAKEIAKARSIEKKKPKGQQTL
jgi:5-methylcytosine-specific restriction endonuclease McrA